MIDEEIIKKRLARIESLCVAILHHTGISLEEIKELLKQTDNELK